MEKPMDSKDIYIIETVNTKTRSLGLCSTCNNLQHCVFSQSIDAFIWQCDEFDDSVPAKDMESASDIHTATSLDGPEFDDSRIKRNGICTNCRNIGTCKYVPIEGGRWHCEDYL